MSERGDETRDQEFPEEKPMEKTRSEDFKPEADLPSAEEIYKEFLERRRNGENIEIGEYCEKYPSRRNALQLMALVPDGELPLGSESAVAVDLGWP